MRLTAAMVAVVFVTLACASDGEDVEVSSADVQQAETVEDALPLLREMVDAAAEVIAAGFDVQPDEGSVPVACEDGFGNFDSTITAPYGIKFGFPEGTDIPGLFEKARAYWSERGYNVSDVDLTISDPALESSKDGYWLALHVVVDQRMAYVGGDTPCLPKAEDASA